MAFTFQTNGSAKTESEPPAVEENGETNLEGPAVVQDSAAASVVGERVEVSDSLVISAVADELHATDTLIVVGTVGSLSGNAHVLISPQAALAFGAGLGLVLAVAGRLLRGRKGTDQAS